MVYQAKIVTSLCLKFIEPWSILNIRNMTNETNLNSKVWYRTLKVMYVLSFLILIVIVQPYILIGIPHQDTLNGKVQKITCDNGKVYYPKKEIFVQGDGSLYDTDDIAARKLCVYGANNYGNSNLAFPTNRNYKTTIGYPTIGSWQNIFYAETIVFLVILILLETTRRTILYISLGLNFFTLKKNL